MCMHATILLYIYIDQSQGRLYSTNGITKIEMLGGGGSIEQKRDVQGHVTNPEKLWIFRAWKHDFPPYKKSP